ncbi:MAG TPA: hypothetical protein PLD20_00950 [Blastocatellia bacterium]|nr:hypothetical protein [Blastocatellia bacterium]HMV81815.1 hypothetical protein [Blastocatellia bacterium]HMX24004.1 hypothetical protein [Blastocatellia bacterium]HMY70434.1 hypothetical protein [Blastocatellia bacterium]HMZ16503.1 hypothetical protein [Blastocatellia bacterium]
MANKIKAQNQYGIAWPVTVAAATLLSGDIVKVTGNETVDEAAAGDVPRGEIVIAPKNTTDKATVMLKGRAVVEILFNGNIAANAEVKMSSLSSGEQRVAAWVQGTDNENLKVGWVLVGANGAVGKVVLY